MESPEDDSQVLQIEPMLETHWPQVKSIYLQGIATGHATFETTTPEWPAWDQNHRPDCRLIARRGSTVVAWAALSPVSRRQVYAGVAEVSIYVEQGNRGQGIARLLMRALVDASERAGIWTLQASIFPENDASVQLHYRFGFRLVGRRERIAQHFGVWRDVVILERRSQQVGSSDAPQSHST